MKLSEQIAAYEASKEWKMDGALAEALIARVRELEAALENLVSVTDAVAWCYIHEGYCEEMGWGLPPDAVENEATLLYLGEKADEEAYKEIRKACDENLAKFAAENAALQDKLKLAELWRTGYEKVEAENAALRSPIATDDAMRIVQEWYDADESGVELIRRAEAWKNAHRK